MLQISQSNIEELIQLRHELHSLAEVSGEEKNTALRIASFLETTNPDELTTGVGGEGIIARYVGEGSGPKILIRCELDALPIPEEVNLEYHSRNEDTGHKCGHDGHMAIVCGLAQMLNSGRPERGEVILLFQPAEETGEGARRVLQDEAFASIQPDFVFALHNLPGYPRNQIVVKKGSFAAASVGLILRLKGETSHAAHPEEGRSPALALSQIVQHISALPQFYVPLNRSAKATVIHARLGERAFGTSPGEAEVMVTLRSFDQETLEQMKKRSVELAEGVCQTFGLKLETEWVESFQITENDADSVELIESVAQDLGLEVCHKLEPFNWSEDFGHFTQKYPGAMFGLGAGEDHPALHSSHYDFPDELLQTGIQMFGGIIEQLTVEN